MTLKVHNHKFQSFVNSNNSVNCMSLALHNLLLMLVYNLLVLITKIH